MYISRKVVYPVFIVLFAIAFFTLIYFVSFSQQVSVENASVELVGEEVLLKADIINNSNHFIRDAELLVVMSGEETTAKLDPLGPKEVFNVVMPLPISSDLRYDVYVNVPLRKPLHLFFELEESTIKPVTASVQLVSNMVIGQKYNYIVKLCNISENDLSEVTWIELFEGTYFAEETFPRTTSIQKDECKNLYSTLTPINPGQAKINFALKVGEIEQNSSHVINIVSGE
jgi:hypothetical protein